MAHLNGELFHWTKLPRVEVDCPLCSSKHSRTYHKYGDELQYTFVRCTDCSFIYQNPRFEYNDLFLQWAYSWYGDDFIEKVKALSISSFLNDNVGYHQYKKDLIEKYCEKRPYTLLDVGCACGQFLSFFHGKNCLATGVETSQKQVNFIADHFKFEAVCGTLETLLPARAQYFDVTHIAHTLEHLPNPKETISQLKALTKPGGLVFVEVPNVRSYQNRMSQIRANFGLRKNLWKSDDFPEHLVEFTPKTLRKLMQDSGLEIVFLQTHSRKLLNRNSPSKVLIDHFTNRIFPWANNLICIGKRSAE
jgi:2-polyprenyl-3-methyl-5-hydroxy-6-metoxy-1,4-benzoquinol methylase